MAREAVIFETPAASATSINVTPRGEGNRGLAELEGEIGIVGHH